MSLPDSGTAVQVIPPNFGGFPEDFRPPARPEGLKPLILSDVRFYYPEEFLDQNPPRSVREIFRHYHTWCRNSKHPGARVCNWERPISIGKALGFGKPPKPGKKPQFGKRSVEKGLDWLEERGWIHRAEAVVRHRGRKRVVKVTWCLWLIGPESAAWPADRDTTPAGPVRRKRARACATPTPLPGPMAQGLAHLEAQTPAPEVIQVFKLETSLAVAGPIASLAEGGEQSQEETIPPIPVDDCVEGLAGPFGRKPNTAAPWIWSLIDHHRPDLIPARWQGDAMPRRPEPERPAATPPRAVAPPPTPPEVTPAAIERAIRALRGPAGPAGPERVWEAACLIADLWNDQKWRKKWALDLGQVAAGTIPVEAFVALFHKARRSNKPLEEKGLFFGGELKVLAARGFPGYA